MNSIIAHSQMHKDKNLPFVLFRKPNSEKLFGIFQKSKDLFFSKNLKETGFVFAPFNNLEESILFPEYQTEIKSEHIKDFSVQTNNSKSIQQNLENDQKHFESLVEQSINAIKKGLFQKVVVSRINDLHTDEFDLFSSFQNALHSYPNAFVYLWYHPKVGTWLGATPERLVEVNGTSYRTVALAGTISETDFKSSNWSSKEILEQKIVADYILEELNPISGEIFIGDSGTTRAGNLYHLKSSIHGRLNNEMKLIDLVSKLHPTPAVGGFPKEEAISFILKNEGYNRSFYSGFLGMINSQDHDRVNSELFVNLRCMEIFSSSVRLYAGCGITRDSIPHKEWLETVNKMKTMQAILA
ncbi:isochorismate synthase [Aegicerativicinus sediminis]|uniref:isochorismate synthase n=1 Tax=Aegicerativicinus sediminis TaxID=2893202 RepID=UPI001E3605CE|nr:isochorismate synthase [Aegicerativicinus sediminis]